LCYLAQHYIQDISYCNMIWIQCMVHYISTVLRNQKQYTYIQNSAVWVFGVCISIWIKYWGTISVLLCCDQNVFQIKWRLGPTWGQDRPSTKFIYCCHDDCEIFIFYQIWKLYKVLHMWKSIKYVYVINMIYHFIQENIFCCW
jgi:hypothetical protein